MQGGSLSVFVRSDVGVRCGNGAVSTTGKMPNAFGVWLQVNTQVAMRGARDESGTKAVRDCDQIASVVSVTRVARH